MGLVWLLWAADPLCDFDDCQPSLLRRPFSLPSLQRALSAAPKPIAPPSPRTPAPVPHHRPVHHPHRCSRSLRHVGIVDLGAQARRLETTSAHFQDGASSLNFFFFEPIPDPAAPILLELPPSGCGCGPCRCSREPRLEPWPPPPPTCPNAQGPPCRMTLVARQVRKSIARLSASCVRR